MLCLLAFAWSSELLARTAWKEFSLAPATGQSIWKTPEALRSDGMTLKHVVAIAFGFPPVRVTAPDWLSTERYAIRAVAHKAGDFDKLLRREITRLLRVKVHTEQADFDVYVLRKIPGAKPRLKPAASAESGIRAGNLDMTARTATPAGLASVLQNVLGRPVIDQTGLRGRYDFQLSWPDRSEESVLNALKTQLNLALSSERRRMEKLVIDRAERGISLVMMSGVSRLSSDSPPAVRGRVSPIFSVH
ncbi:MAG: TIGR03435 family protein [Bryobacteraceae bacterium]